MDGPSAAEEASGALVELWLVPEETVTAGELQLGLWGDTGPVDERAGRALVRVQALLGPESVVTAVLVGGRDPAEQVRLIPWGDDRAIEGAVASTAPPPEPEPALPGAVLPAEEVWDELGPRDDPMMAPAGWPDDAVRAHGRVPRAGGGPRHEPLHEPSGDGSRRRRRGG